MFKKLLSCLFTVLWVTAFAAFADGVKVRKTNEYWFDKGEKYVRFMATNEFEIEDVVFDVFEGEKPDEEIEYSPKVGFKREELCNWLTSNNFKYAILYESDVKAAGSIYRVTIVETSKTMTVYEWKKIDYAIVWSVVGNGLVNVANSMNHQSYSAFSK